MAADHPACQVGRAGTGQLLEGLSQSQLRDAIRDERRWELAGEEQRRLDLIRWGILEEVVRNTEYRVYNPALTIQPHHNLLPIPRWSFS